MLTELLPIYDLEYCRRTLQTYPGIPLPLPFPLLCHDIPLHQNLYPLPGSPIPSSTFLVVEPVGDGDGS